MAEEKSKVKVQRDRKRVYESVAEKTAGDIQPAKPVKKVPAKAAAAVPKKVVTDKGAPVSAGQETIVVTENTPYADALKLVRKYAAWSAGAGLVPVPLFDMVAMTAVQIAMLKKLAGIYGVPFSEQRSKSAVAALIGGLNAGYLGGSALKMFPVIGLFSLAAMPAVNGAITYAVGRVFIQHFASGGTFLDFDPSKVQAYFEQQYLANR